MAYLNDYRVAHSLDPALAEQAGLPENSRVLALPEGCGRSELLRAASSSMPDWPTDERVMLIHTGQTRPSVHRMFGATPAEALGAPRSVAMISSACASGVEAVVLADELVSANAFDTVLVAVASDQSRGDWVSFDGVGALTDGDVRPFDRRSTGVKLGAFAGVLIISNKPSAHAVQIVGHGALVTGAGAASSTRDQIEVMKAATATHRPDIVVAHATGTQQGDRAEFDALNFMTSEVWNGPVTAVSHKGALGHTVQAAGIASIAMACEAMRRGWIPGTYGLSEPIVPTSGVDLPLSEERVTVAPDTTILVNGFGFGGNNYAVTLTMSHHNEQGEDDGG